MPGPYPVVDRGVDAALGHTQVNDKIMQINIGVTQAELDKMNVTKAQPADVIITRLDDATLPGQRPAISLSGYNSSQKSSAG